MFQLVQNWENRRVIDNLSLDNLINRIKNPTEDFKNKVTEIRKLKRKSKEYDALKSTFPCFTTAFTFKGYINKANAVRPTGYLYLDVDEEDSINLDHSSVVFYCKSISGKGYSIIVGVIGVTKDNIKEVTYSIAQELDIKLDERAVSPDRLTVLSYDINTYYNPEHTFFLFEDNNLKNPHYNTNNIFNISNECNGGKIKLDNLSEITKNIEFNGEFLKDYGKDKIQYVKLVTPFKDVIDGERNTKMNTLCYFLKGLNPFSEKKEIESYLSSINVAKFKPPLSDKEMLAIIDSVFRLPLIELTPNAERRFIYNTDYDLTTKEKRQENIKVLNQDRINKTIKELEYIIDNWDTIQGIITQKTLAIVSGKNMKTVERHYFKIKQKIKDKNLCIKNK